MPGLARRIGLFDATMVVMGGIVGSGIFVTPAIVASHAHSEAAMLGVWLVGGAAALLGAFIYSELSAARPSVGGQYAYLREAYHPAAAFLYGWALLLVIQTGGMAANAITFARHVVPLPIGESATAALAVAALTIVNCLGVSAGAKVQSALMVLKILAIAALVVCGLFAGSAPAVARQSADSFGAALVPVLFSYGGWQTACFVAGEMKEPRRDLPRALVIGVAAVIALYVSVAYAFVRVLGPEGLAQSSAPAVDVMTRAVGSRGASLIAAGIAISTLGFLSQSILTAPRVYFAMAADGVFFRGVAGVSSRTQAPVAAIALQGVVTIALVLAGTYEAILNYVTAIDFIFFALTAGCVFVFRKRGGAERTIPGHPVTTLLFIAICAAVVVSSFRAHPLQALIGWGITLLGLPVFFLWRRRS
jgi:APA family basic amino acid/polyamine antiporter